MCPHIATTPQELIGHYLVSYVKQYIALTRSANNAEHAERAEHDWQENITTVAATVQDDQGPLPKPEEEIHDDLDNDIKPCKTSSKPTTVPLLRRLLAASRPSLLRILPAMIEIGFKSDEVLEEVLSWPAHQLVGAVEKWHTAGHLPISIVEREALIQQFCSQRNSR
jgi:hypothetical protein